MNAWAGGVYRVLAVVVVLVVPTLLSAASAGAGGIRVESRDGAAAAFWTPARMRQAQPLAANEPGAGPPEFGSDFEQVPDPTAPELRVHGAIFLSLGIFGYGRCSGTAVAAPNESVVITAGHCVNSGGRRGRWFPGKWVFVPAYRFGQRPFGVFAARWMDTTREWRSSGSENSDVGAVVVGRNRRGETLGEAVGGVGIAWNLKPRQTFDVHGYPAEAPFDGETQRICRERPFLGHDPSAFVDPGPLNLAVSCGVTGGASGGGWIIHGDTLNSVTDYGHFDKASPVFGAYFGTEVGRLYRRAGEVR